VPDAERVRQLRERYGNKKIVFSLGRLVHYKGFKYLVDAARYLDDSYLVIIGGSGMLKDELQQQIHDYGLEQRVKMVGRISDEDLPSYYGACDIYCLSSIMKTEAFALVQLEAMSCGKPVVSCNIEGSGVPWVNKDDYSGLVVEPENGKALADAIRRIMEDKALYYTYSAGARSRYIELFKKQRMIDRCLELYSQLLHS
jgi:rhamnosyl/mannosyltransferase